MQYLQTVVAHHTSDRRLASRWPIQLAVTCRMIGKRAAGNIEFEANTKNMSSSGVLLTTSHVLKIGARVQMDIKWPVLFDDRRPLKLTVKGRVRRVDVDNGTAALTFSGLEFRTLPVTSVDLQSTERVRELKEIRTSEDSA